MTNTRHSPWYRPRRRAWGLASSISEPAACGSFWCQNMLPKDCYDNGWLALFRWPWTQKVGSGGKAPHQLCLSLFGLIASILEPRNQSLAVAAAAASCYSYWPNKVPYWLAWFGASSRTGRAVGEHEFRRWEPDVGAIGWPKRIDLIEWHLLVKTINDEEFVCFQSKAFLLHLCFFEKNETIYLQPHSPCPGNNKSKNDT